MPGNTLTCEKQAPETRRNEMSKQTSSYKFASIREAGEFWAAWVEPTIRILRGDCYEWVKLPNGRRDYVQTYDGRPWFIQQYTRHKLHPAVLYMFRLYRPADWQRVILEWPHKALTDPNRLAYTRDEKSAMYEGDSDRKALVTTIGKYLTRHWPDVPSNLIRDIVAEHTYGGSITLTESLDEMIKAVINGPRSCMSHSFDLRCDDGARRHPYAVYDPSLGWGMAVRYDEDGEVLGRCLVWRGDHAGDADFKCFVRSYKRERDETSHSGADEAIESWLRGRGFVREHAWPDGLQLMRYNTWDGGYLMPYIDGGTQHVDSDSFTIDSNGDLDATNTSGTVEEGNCTCEDCGRRYDSDNEGIAAGVYEDHNVCGHCADGYTYAYSRRGNGYYIPNDRAVEVGGEYYDTDYLSDNDIVQLHDGEYCSRDDAVWIESVDEYYHCDDDDICYAEDTGQYELKDDCWRCEDSGNWYTDNEDYVEIDGDRYHPDHAPEQDEDEDEDADAAETTATTTEIN
jgi:hypothetical protein